MVAPLAVAAILTVQAYRGTQKYFPGAARGAAAVEWRWLTKVRQSYYFCSFFSKKGHLNQTAG